MGAAIHGVPERARVAGRVGKRQRSGRRQLGKRAAAGTRFVQASRRGPPRHHRSGLMPGGLSLSRRSAGATADEPPTACLAQVIPLLLWAVLTQGCAHPRPIVPDEFVNLNNHSLRLHFDNAKAPATRPLLVYATGDGGMHRKDLDTYRHLAALGDPLVGFDARDYVKHLGDNVSTTTPERLAEDYARIIERARQTLGIDPLRPGVLVGVSLGL